MNELRDRPAPAIRVEGLTRRFGRRWALRGVDLEIEAGAVVALLGANGTGKTTLLRVLATLLRPTAGTVMVLGNDVVADADAIRRTTALMTPAGHVYDELTGRENLRFAARMCGDDIDDTALDHALGEVGLGDAGDITVHGYSTGMRKRLELARVGMRELDLVLLDEPFTSLDEPGVALVQDAIARWKATGTTILIASHRVEETRRHAERTLRLAGGVISNDSGGP
jgi:heme ABC exporter ATP-binding subunit CcmA